MTAIISTLILAAEEAEAGNDPSDLFPEVHELFWGAVAFGVLFLFMTKFAFPRINRMLDARRERIQGELERAERARTEADVVLADYRRQLAGAREESNRIIEEARRTAEAMRSELLARAEREAGEIVSRAQEDIRAERDQVFRELRSQVGELSVQLATRIIGDSLDRERQLRLVDDYIDQLAAMPSGPDGATAAGTHKVTGE